MSYDNLPKPLQTLLDISKVNRLKIDLSRTDNDFVPTLTSKIGGIGYLPIGESYPTNAGKPLVMLAQLNFEQISQSTDTAKLPHRLPQKGILQIYIDSQDDCYGQNFDDKLPNDLYQVRFWQDTTLPINTDELNQISEQLKALDIDILPFDFENQYPMQFTLDTQSCHISCCEYNHFSQKIDELKDCDIWDYLEENLQVDNPYEYVEIYDKLANSSGHKIFGYPEFTQDDPRGYEKRLQEHILLLQIDTDGDNDIMWGDCGVANFFIHPDDLKNEDFSKLIYNWDCH